MGINNSNNKVRHSGVIRSIEGARAKVEVSRTSACGTCDMSQNCHKGGGDKMLVEVSDSGLVGKRPGDEVVVEMSSDMGHKAVAIGFVLPLAVFVGIILLLHYIGWSDVEAALASVASLAVYYTILYMARTLIGRQFRISIVK